MRLTVSLDQTTGLVDEPLTATRSIGDCWVAGKTLRDWQALAFREAGLDWSEDAVGELRLKANAWISSVALKALDSRPLPILTQGTDTLSHSTDEKPPQQDVGEEGLLLRYPWQFLNLQEQLLKRFTASEIHEKAQLHDRATVDGVLILGEGSRVLPGVYIEGVAVIGRNCKIGPNAYLRGMTSIGDNCHIGQAVEVKNSIIYPDTAMGHLSYCGDSIVGQGVNFGAGTIVSNFRHDGKNHRSLIGDTLIDTGRRKFGAIIGDGVHTGIHTSIYPGRKLWPHTSTRPGDIVHRDLASPQP